MELKIWGDFSVSPSHTSNNQYKYYWNQESEALDLPKAIPDIVDGKNQFMAAKHSLSYITRNPDNMNIIVSQELAEHNLSTFNVDESGNASSKIIQNNGSAYNVSKIIYPTLPDNYWILNNIEHSTDVSGNILEISSTFPTQNKEKYSKFKDLAANVTHNNIPVFYAPVSELAVKFTDIWDNNPGRWPKNILHIANVEWNETNEIMETVLDSSDNKKLWISGFARNNDPYAINRGSIRCAKRKR